MPTEGETQNDNLAGNDQAGSQGQSDAQLWMQKYNGLNGKLLTTQTQLAEARSGILEEKTRWENERNEIVSRAAETQAAYEAAQAQLTDIMGKYNGLATQSETLANQLARQRVMLDHPHLISDPIMKLVENSTLTADDLAATLGAMAQGQQQLIKQVYQEAQSGSTQAVGTLAAQGNVKQEQAQVARNEALDAMAKGDMATYRTKYAEYLAFADKNGGSKLAAPVVMASKPI